jgi:hypothetical protein
LQLSIDLKVRILSISTHSGLDGSMLFAESYYWGKRSATENEAFTHPSQAGIWLEVRSAKIDLVIFMGMLRAIDLTAIYYFYS